MNGSGRRPGVIIGVAVSVAAHIAAVLVLVLLPPHALSTWQEGSGEPSVTDATRGFAGQSEGRRGTGDENEAAVAVVGGGGRKDGRSNRPGTGNTDDIPVVVLPSPAKTLVTAVATSIERRVVDARELLVHLGQTTLFILVVAMLTLLVRRSAARVRYALWLVASMKFLVPLSWFSALGVYAATFLPAPSTRAEALSAVLSAPMPLTASDWSESIASTLSLSAAPVPVTGWLISASLAGWLLGFSAIVIRRWLTWRRTVAAVHAGTPVMNVRVTVPGLEVRSIPGLLEPGVVGWRRPVLLLPADLAAHLTPAQLDAVVEHEACHVRRRDNLTAIFHMTVEALFWFHPFVWWIGGRLVAERERACDEAVVGRGHNGTLYAEAILKTCARYLASPLACVAGVTSSNLRDRLEYIVAGRMPVPVNLWKRCVLAATALLVVTMPLAAGMSRGVNDAAALAKATSGARFDVASIRVNPAGRNQPASTEVLPGGRYMTRNTPLHMLIGQAYDVPHQRLLGGPDWIESTHFDIDATANRELYPSGDERPLEDALRTLLEERFRLVARTDTRQLPVFDLVLARADRRLGPNLSPSSRDCQALLAARRGGGPPLPPPPSASGQIPPCGMRTLPGALQADSVPMSFLTAMLGDELRRPVLDRTGLSGHYSVQLTWTPGSIPSRPSDAPAEIPVIDPHGPPIVTAVQEQLRLRLQPSIGPVEVVVIDSVQQPTPN